VATKQPEATKLTAAPISSSITDTSNTQNDTLKKEVIVKDASDPEIYAFMQMAIAKLGLNKNYAVSVEPEKNCSNNDDETSFLNSLLIKRAEKITFSKDSISGYSIPSVTSYIILEAANLPNCLTKSDVQTMIDERIAHKNFKWNNERLGFNPFNKKKWYSFSVPVFSNNKTKVLLKIEDLCPGLCGWGKVVLFTKQKNVRWKTDEGANWIH
jgi:hypothetical protein